MNIVSINCYFCHDELNIVTDFYHCYKCEYNNEITKYTALNNNLMVVYRKIIYNNNLIYIDYNTDLGFIEIDSIQIPFKYKYYKNIQNIVIPPKNENNLQLKINNLLNINKKEEEKLLIKYFKILSIR